MYDPAAGRLPIADLIEVECPRETLKDIETRLAAIARSTKKAHALLEGDLTDPGAHGIFLTLEREGPFIPHAIATLKSVLAQPHLAASDKTTADRLIQKTINTDETLWCVVRLYYTRISTPYTHRRRPRFTVRELIAYLQKADTGLCEMLRQYKLAADTAPSSVSAEHLKTARAHLKHNRTEILYAASQLPQPGKVTGNTETDILNLTAQEYLVSIANLIERLEAVFQDIERRQLPVMHGSMN